MVRLSRDIMKKLILISLISFTTIKPISMLQAPMAIAIGSASGILYTGYYAGTLLLKIKTIDAQLKNKTLRPDQRAKLVAARKAACATLKKYGYGFLASMTSMMAWYMWTPNHAVPNNTNTPPASNNPNNSNASQPNNNPDHVVIRDRGDNQDNNIPDNDFDRLQAARLAAREEQRRQQNAAHNIAPTNDDIHQIAADLLRQEEQAAQANDAAQALQRLHTQNTLVQAAREAHINALQTNPLSVIDVRNLKQIVQNLNPSDTMHSIACPICTQTPHSANNTQEMSAAQLFQQFWIKLGCNHPLCVSCKAIMIHNNQAHCPTCQVPFNR